MTKGLAVLVCLLGISAPAYAGSGHARITLSCRSLSTDVITGTATVTLCGASALPCSSPEQVPCPAAFACDSSANPSETSVCHAPFKVDAISYSESFADYDDLGNLLASGSSSGSSTLAKGKVGFASTQVSGTGDGNTVTLEVK